MKSRRKLLLIECLEDRRLLAGDQPPNVLSVVRADNNPTSAAAINFTVTFDEPVRFVDATDFQLVSGGNVSGATVTQVNASTADTFNSIYTVAVSSGSGDGSLKLDVLDDNSILDQQGDPLGGSGANNGAFISGESYTIDRIAPQVTSIQRASTSPTVNTTLAFNVLFNQTVTGVDTSDFALNVTGVSGATIDSVSGSGTSYTVSVTHSGGNGTVGLNLVDNNSIVDAAGNALGGATLGDGDFVGETITILPPISADLSVWTSGHETGPVNIVYTVTLNRANDTGGPVTFDVTDLGTGSAVAGLDYVALAANTQITIGDGADSAIFNVTVLDDDLVEASQTVNVQIANVSHPQWLIGVASATASISDNEVATLSIAIDDATISEAAGNSATSVTISRNSVPTDPLVLTLTSSDPSEATIQATATIPAGQYSVTVPLNAIDDLLADGSQTVTVSATANGHSDASGMLQVDDDDLDFGDAPSPYRTTFADGGAYHLATGPRLGLLRDTDTDGAPTTDANGDDTLGQDDEDGVTFASLRIGDNLASVVVDVQNAPSGAWLDAWIDFNHDGSWGGTFERVAARIPVALGANTVEFAIPGASVTGQTYARFRISSTGGLGPNGFANDGEVEDYAVTLFSPTGSGQFGAQQTVGTLFTGQRNDVADFNGDGHLDVVGVAFENAIRWYQNDGDGNFTTHVVTDLAGTSNGQFAIGDLDADGDIDIVNSGNGLALYQNDGAGNFTRAILHSSSGSEVLIADFDGDGKNDVVTAGLIFRQTAPLTFTSGLFGRVNLLPIDAADIDNDGDMDMSGLNRTSDQFGWFENDGTGNFIEHIIANGTIDDPFDIDSSDMDSDGDIDFVVGLFTGQSVLWFENDGNQNFTQKTASTLVGRVRSVKVADIDGDGANDILVAGNNIGGPQILFNDGTEVFSKIDLQQTTSNFASAVVGDIDEDSDLDVIAAPTASTVMWFENLYSDDQLDPSVISITATPNYFIGTGNLTARVTFSEAVTGVDLGDFQLAITGAITGASVTSVVPVSGGAFDVVIATGTGDGTLQLRLVDNETVFDFFGNQLGGPGIVNGDFLSGTVVSVERNPLRNIVGTLYSDNDRDGQPDAGEPGVSGLRVYVDTNNNSVWNSGEPSVFTDIDNPATTEVDESGAYRFDGLALGTYTVRVESNTAFFSSAASSTIVTLSIESPPDTNKPLGVEPNLTAIRGAVFSDLNANGVVDLGEAGLAGMTVYRDLNNNGVLDVGESSQLTLSDDPATTGIDEAGTFDFGQLPFGTTRIRVHVPSNYMATTSALFTGTVTSSVDVFSNVSFLLRENLTSVSGVLYNDLNSNGTQDAGEGPLSGLVVYVDSDQDGIRDTGEKFTTSAADGSYTITNVTPGNVLVRVVTVGQTTVTSPTFQSERLFVSNSSTLREINSTTGAQISSFFVSPVATRGATSGGLAFNGTSVFMLDRVDNRILVINPSTGVVTSTLGPLPTSYYGGLAYVNSLLYASDNTNERILAINPATGVVVSTFNVATLNAGSPFYNGTIDLLDGLGESADGTKLLAGTASLQRLIINPATGIVEGAYTDLANLRDLGIAGGGGRIFVGRRDTSSVQVYNADGQLTSTLNNVSTADDVAASAFSRPGANLTLVVDQQVSGVNFGIGSSFGAIAGRQYQDVNQNGSYDSGDIPIAGVRVYVDANNNESLDVAEASALSSADGTYSITGVIPGSYAVRVVAPANFRPASSYPASNRLFGISLETGTSLVRLIEFNPITGATIRSNVTTIVGTANSEIAYDGNRILLVNSSTTLANNNIYELAIDGTILDQRPLQTGTVVSDFGPVVVGGVIFTLRGTGASLSLHRYDTETKQFVYQRPVTYNWNPQSFQLGASTPFPVLAYVSGVSTDGQSIILGTSDDRILTIDPVTGIANFAMTASNLLPVDYARDSVGGEMYVAQNGPIAVFNAAGTQVRTLGVNRLLHGLGAGVHRMTATAVTATAGQTVSNVDHRFVSTRSTISGTIITDANGNRVNDAGDSPLAGVAVYLDNNRNSVYDIGEPQVVTNSSGQYTFTDVVPGEYVVRQVPANNQALQAWTANYNRLFTRTLANGVATISELDPFTGQVLRQFPTPGTNLYQTGLALRGDILYVSQSSSLYALDANTGTQISATPLPFGQLDGLAIIGDKAYVLQSTTNTILVVDLATKQLERTINVQSTNPSYVWNLINGLGESADGTLLAARNNSDVSILDPATGLLEYTIPSVFAGAGFAGAGGETYDQGNYVNNVQVFTDVRDRNGLIRRSLPYNFGVTANGYAAANVQATEHRVRVFGEQSIANLNFGNVPNTAISGTQYVDVNQNGVLDANDTRLSGVTVFADLNNDYHPSPNEPSTVSAADGSYTLSNLPNGPVIVRSVAPANHVPTGSSRSVTRLFSTYPISDATTPTARRLGIREIHPVNGQVISQTPTNVVFDYANSITFDSGSLIVVDTNRKVLTQLTTSGTVLAEVAVPGLQIYDRAIGVVNVNSSVFVLTYHQEGTSLKLQEYDSRSRSFIGAKTVTQPPGPLLTSVDLTLTLSESPDGRSILAFSLNRDEVYVIDPITATLVEKVSSSSVELIFRGASALNGELLGSNSGNLYFFDGEFRSVRNVASSLTDIEGLGAVSFSDFGLTAVLNTGLQLTGFNQSFRSSLPRDGELDRDFGNRGVTTNEFFSNPNSFDEYSAVAVDSLGRTITVGSGGYILRHNADGSLDTTFGTNGFSHFPGTAVDVAINSSRQIIVAGSVFTGNGFQFVLARYLSDGSLDLSFGDQGTQRTSFSTVRANAAAMALQPDGKIVVAGVGSDASVTYRDILIARYLPNGQLDLTFSEDGITTSSINAYDYATDVAIMNGNEAVVVGSTLVGATYDMAIWQFTNNGLPKASFDGDGVKTIDFTGTDDEAFGLAINAGNTISVAGYTKVGSYESLAVAQIGSTGALVNAFDSDGKVVTNVYSGNDRADGIAIDSAGKLVLTGSAASTSGLSDIALVRYNSNGSLDTTFDVDGIATTNIASRSDVGRDLAVTSSGKIIVAGSADLSLSPNNYDALLVRYNNDGSLDTTYQSTGKVTTPIRVSTDEAYSVALQADGKLIAAGSSRNSSNLDFALARYDSYGRLDATYGTTGKVTTAIGSGDDVARRVVIRNDGKAIAVGRTKVGTNWNIAIAQYNVDGTLDTSFGTAGIVTTDLGSTEDDAIDVVLDANQRIVVVGQKISNGSDIVLARYLPSGLLDTSFGTAGLTTFSLGASNEIAASVLVQSDEKILIGGYSSVSGNNDFIVARFLANGTLDTTFDTDGWVGVDLGSTHDYLQSLALTHTGKIVVAGTRDAAGNFDFAISQLNSDGSLDQSFGTSGVTTTDFTGGSDVIRRVRVAEDGKLVVGGYSSGLAGLGADFALARYTSAGLLDSTFEGNGKSTTEIGVVDNVGWDMVIDHFGDFVIAGSANTGASTDFAVARYTGPGTSDVVVDSSGNLLIRHSTTNSNRTIRFDGTNLIVTDSVANITSPIAGATGSGSSTVSLPLSSFTGGLVYRSSDGNQTLTLDLSLATLPRPVTILAESGQDQLVVSGGNAAQASLQFTSPHAGQIDLSNNGLITFSGISNVDLGTSVQTISTSYPDNASLFSIGTPSIGQVRITHTGAPNFTLAMPSQSLVVNAGNGDDTILMSGLPTPFTANFSIVGGSGKDTFTLAGPVTLAGGDFSIDVDDVTIGASVSTTGGDIHWSASDDIQLNAALNSGGGNVTINSDSDADGVGLFQIRPVITSQYGNSQIVTASDGTSGDFFGRTIVVFGNTAFVGADGDDDRGNSSGSVYVFTKLNGVWTQTQKIVPSDGQSFDYFGSSIAFDSDTVVIGATGHRVGANRTGAAFVYRNVSGLWTLEQKLVASDADAGDSFGSSVAIQGDRIVVGASSDSQAANGAGALYVFARSGTVWNQQQKLTATNAAPFMRIGINLALDGDTIVAGESSNVSTPGGAAYVFTLTNNVWSQSQILLGDDPRPSDGFGRSVDILGNRIVIGVPYSDFGMLDTAGAAYVFEKTSGTWIKSAKLLLDNATTGSRFGHNVSLGLNSLVVVAQYGPTTSSNQGTAVSFLFEGEAWYQQSTVASGIHVNVNSFGDAVAHDVQTLVVGALTSTTPSGSTGSVYFYDLVPSTATGGSIQANSGNVEISTSLVELRGTVAGTGTLSIRPSVASSSIGLGGALGTLNLDDFELSQTSDGFSHITVGNETTGTGTISVSSSTFNDPVTIAGGTIRVNDSGGITAPEVTLSGEISPGNSPGLLNVDGDTIINSGSSVIIEFAGIGGPGSIDGHDQVSSTGRVDIEPSVALTLVGLGTVGGAERLVIVERTGGSGTFASIPEGHVFTNPFGSGQDFHITYAGGDGDDIVLVGHNTPTDVTLSSTSINENVNTTSADILFATLGASDPDTGETHLYSLVSGDGSADNNSFRVVGNQLFVKQGTVLDFETKPNYLVRLRVTDSTGLTFDKELNLQVNNLIEIQKSNVRINDGSAQRSRVDSVTIEFDTDVILQEGAITVRKRGSSGGFAGVVITPLAGVASRTFTLTFAGGFTQFGSLAEGNYELRVDATKIISVGGFGLDTNQDGNTGDDFLFGNEATDKFFRLLGDSDGNRNVNLLDFSAFRSSFGKTIGNPGYRAYFDFNQDGVTSLTDFAQFRNRFGSTLPFE